MIRLLSLLMIHKPTTESWDSHTIVAYHFCRNDIFTLLVNNLPFFNRSGLCRERKAYLVQLTPVIAERYANGIFELQCCHRTRGLNIARHFFIISRIFLASSSPSAASLRISCNISLPSFSLETAFLNKDFALLSFCGTPLPFM